MIAPTLKGKKVILKPNRINQAAKFLSWLKNPEITQFMTIDGKKFNLAKEKKYLKDVLRDKNKINWSIYFQNRHIGGTGMTLSPENNKAVWGIFIGDKSEWGKGLATDTLNTVIKYCFKKLNLNKVELAVFSPNMAAIRCYEKCGFLVEGVKRQSICKNGIFYDEIVMGILKKDWFKKLN